mgnify:CR=1 FL=1
MDSSFFWKKEIRLRDFQPVRCTGGGNGGNFLSGGGGEKRRVSGSASGRGILENLSIQNGKLYAELVREETAPEAQGFSPEFLEENGAVVKAELSGTFENGERTESLGNREDLESLERCCQRQRKRSFL